MPRCSEQAAPFSGSWWRSAFLTLAGAIFLASALVFLLCTFRVSAAFAGERPRIGIVMPSFRESRWQHDMASLETEAARRQVDILVRVAGNSQPQQNLQMKELVNLGVQALLLTPVDVSGAMEGVAYAKERQVAVVCYDRLAENCPVDAYVAFERFGVGELMGKFLATYAPSGNYVLLYGPRSDSNAADFFAGAMRILRPLIDKGKIKVLLESEVAGWRADIGERLMSQTLAKTTDITAVLAPNDDVAGGVIAALKRYDLAGKVLVTGQDATEAAVGRLYEGSQSMTIVKDTGLLAKKAIDVALTLVRNQELSLPTRIDNGALSVPACFLPVMFLDKSGINWLLRSVEFH